MANRVQEGQRTDRLFLALADATRRDIVAQTLACNRSVSELARLYPMSFAAVQKHVAVLADAGLVSKHRRGREQRVRGEVDRMGDVHRMLDELKRSGGTASTVSARYWPTSCLPAAGLRRPRLRNPLNSGRRTHDRHRRQRPPTCTMRITAEYTAPVDRVWQLWSDPRLLERWWGPPAYPATIEEHDLTHGGRALTS